MPKPKVLIVEDDFVIFKELVLLFEKQGFDVIQDEPNKAVDSYDAAVALLQTHTPSLAVLDVELNGEKDGLDLGRYIKERFKSVVFLFTGHNTAINQERADSIRADGFLIKHKLLNAEQVLSSAMAMKSAILAAPETAGKQGDFLRVRKLQDNARKEEHPEDLEEHARYIWWKELLYLRTYGPEGEVIKNNIFLFIATGSVYIYHSPLEAMAAKLPPWFVHVNQSAIINIYCLSRYNIRTDGVFINHMFFEISRHYKANMLQKINEFLGGLP